MQLPDNYIYNSAIIGYNQFMKFDFSKTENPISTIAVALNTVYILHADTSYDVKKALKDNKDMIALRTTGGMGCVTIEGMDDITILPGTLLFFEHRSVRRYFCSGEMWDFRWFEFSSNSLFSQPQNRILQLKYDESEHEDYNTCLELLRKSDSSSKLLASSLFSHILCKWTARLKINSISNLHQSSVERIIDHMSSSLPEIISIKELAARTGLCERRFREVFEDVPGIQPKKYYDAMRIGIAVELLRNTTFSIAEISDRLGYSNQFHFTRAFEKVHNTAPSYFRKNNIG
ncbi:MAG: helix-turn-helix transcriptional regulator [Ruminiclostridium sp.]|nr:helix-turn-helix transcriptional regulator [Ruminiclostridium sp.]